jgi:sirohydrochlorin ferrochelatase
LASASSFGFFFLLFIILDATVFWSPAPYFLSNGRHVQEDIPQLVAEAAEATGVRCVVAGHLGLDAGLVNLIMERVDTALEEDAGDA